MKSKIIVIVGSLILLNGCLGVKESRRSQNVDLVKSRYVGACNYLGTVDANVTPKIGGIKIMSEKKTGKELETLAKNNAAEMGGDTIVEASRVRGGRQTFKVYRCKIRR